MSSLETSMTREATLHTLRSRPTVSRRPRPPNLDLSTADEARVPLRNDKISRRESRLGLRNIFGRSKGSREAAASLEPNRPSFATPGTSPSHAEKAEWHQSLKAAQTQATLATVTGDGTSRPLSIATESSEPSQERQRGQTALSKPRAPASYLPPSRDSIASWDEPPLFKAYPQAIRYTTLAAATASADDILRLSEKSAETAGDIDGDTAKDKAKRKKKHQQQRRNGSISTQKLEWTRKTFVLVTSGYLLQYAGEGAFDRPPEKVLQLGRDSAAFVSDIIPGQHFVLQVSAAVEQDDQSLNESRTLFSRLKLQKTAASERRDASNFLLVFDSAGDMDGWLTALRREIEKMGGKRKTSETGLQNHERDVSVLRERPSQRTLVLRDAEHFSQGTSDQGSTNGSVRRNSVLPLDSESSITVMEPDFIGETSLDDISTTNSVMSHDGRQLDALRDSANRLSFISSGQRTMITSATSSPDCSPTVENFSLKPDDPVQTGEARPRPNASSIVDRRRSLQTMAPFIDSNGPASPSSRPQSALIGHTRSDSTVAPSRSVQTPNFSVPSSSNRRYSYVRVSLVETEPEAPVVPAKDYDLPPRPIVRRAPPTSLKVSRPLSMVVDQPSPREDLMPRPATRHGDALLVSTQDDLPAPPAESSLFRNRSVNTCDLPARRSSMLPRDMPIQSQPVRLSPRRLASTGALRGPQNNAPRMHSFVLQDGQQLSRSTGQRSSLAVGQHSFPDRSYSSLDVHDSRQGFASNQPQAMKRASMYAGSSAQNSYADGSRFNRQSTHILTAPPPQGPPPSGPLPPVPPKARDNLNQLRPDPRPRSLCSVRSMPHLLDGPPPAPPPTCALPPIPQKPASRV